MLHGIPGNREYRKLFLAQIISLAGSGVSTIALSLLAYSIAGGNAGVLLGIALGIKMVVFVFFTPLISAFVVLLPRKTLLILLDLVRFFLVLGFFLATQSWHIYALIFFLNLASAAFTPIFQATIPDLLPEESEYNRALSFARIAYDMENIASPVIAGILLSYMSFSYLFVLDAVSFLFSGLLILGATLPAMEKSQLPARIWYRMQFGISSYLKTPRLRYSLALHYAVSFASAMVIVNTVIIVQDSLKGTESMVASAFLMAGVGSILGAFVTPMLLAKSSERFLMLSGVGILAAAFSSGFFVNQYTLLMGVWFFLGLGWSLVQTPAGQLIKKSCRTEDRSAFFSAHFALTHSGWLVAYPAVGFLGKYYDMHLVFLFLAFSSFLLFFFILFLWRSKEELYILQHTHFPREHTHWHEHDEHHRHHHTEEENKQKHSHVHVHSRLKHSHYYVIDHHHRSWLS